MIEVQHGDNIKRFIQIDEIGKHYGNEISRFFDISLEDFSGFLKALIEEDTNFKSIYYKLYVLNLPLDPVEKEKWEKIRERIIKNRCEGLTDITGNGDSSNESPTGLGIVETRVEIIGNKYEKEIRDFFAGVWKNVSPFFGKLYHRDVYDFMNLYYKCYILKLSLNDEEKKEWDRIWKEIQKGFCEGLRETYMKSIKDSDKLGMYGSEMKVPEGEYELSNDAKDFFLKKESSFKPYYMKLAIGEIPLFQYLYYKKYVLKEPLSEDEEKKWNDLKEKIGLKDEQENEDRGG